MSKDDLEIQLDRQPKEPPAEFIAWFSENCGSEDRRKLLGATLKSQLHGFIGARASFHAVYTNLFMNTRTKRERTCYYELCLEYVDYLNSQGYGHCGLGAWLRCSLDTPQQWDTLKGALAQGIEHSDPLAEAVFEDMTLNMSAVLGGKKAKCSGPALDLLTDYAHFTNWFVPTKP